MAAVCKICSIDYDSEENRPVVGTCGHTVCISCSKRVNGLCPTCRQHSFQNPAVNFDLIEQIEMRRNDEANRPSTSRQHQNNNVDENLAKLMEEMLSAQKDTNNDEDQLQQAINMSLIQAEFDNMKFMSEDDQLFMALHESEQTFAMEQARNQGGRVDQLPVDAWGQYNDGRKLYVNNFGQHFDNDSLRRLFETFGRVVSCHTPLDKEGNPRGFGDVTFERQEDALTATTQLNGRILERNRKLVVERYIPKSERDRTK